MNSSSYQKWEDHDHPDLGQSQLGYWRKLFPRDLHSKSVSLMLAVILLLWILLIVVLVKGSKTSQELSQLKEEVRTNASIWKKDVGELREDVAAARRNASALWTDLGNWENKVSESHGRLLKLESEHNEFSTKMTQALAEAGKDRQDIRSEMFRAVAAVRSGNSSCSPCPDSWLAFEGSCYFFSTTKVHWDQSQQNCAQAQAHLVIVNSLEEQTFLTRNTKGLGYWIGLTATRARGKVNGYMWIDGTKLTFSYWNEGEPNDSRRNENCIMMLYSGRWNDAPCNNLNDNWICEKRQQC
ncbi:C-type lectin domain family 4 member G isoform X3 [Phascolarctos cinereus]|uniref:C-type lectin domain family 4 member G isoform X2 n=1 Tax=Phascolarctos cinereus TaxID=38626 RepID=A0A6P5JS76_PHACI|nr:C-type lectin domain family 4 member G isoform X2 [Phascolarctos cinereus]